MANSRVPRRRIEQIVVIPESGAGGTQDIYALCNDGSIWYCTDHPTNSAFTQVDTDTIVLAKNEFNT